MLEDPKSFPDRMRARGTGSHNRQVRAFESQKDGSPARSHIDDEKRDHEGRKFFGTFGRIQRMRLFDDPEAPDAGTNQNTGLKRILFGHVDPGIFECFLGSGYAKLAEPL